MVKKVFMEIIKTSVVALMLISFFYIMFFVAYGDTSNVYADWGMFRLSVMFTVVVGGVVLINAD